MRRPRRTTRCWPPGTRSPRCRARASRPRAEEVRRKLLACRPQEGPSGRASPGRPGGARHGPGEHGRGRRAVRRPVRPARGPAEGARQGGEGRLPEPEWESLRLALHGPKGPLTIPETTDPRRLMLNQRQRSGAGGAQRGHRSAERDRPGGTGPGDGDEGRAEPGRAARLPPRQPGPAGQGGAAAVRPRAGRPAGGPVQAGERPARAGPGHRRPRQPADGPGAGQPRLALALRQGAGRHAQRLRPAERPADRIPSCSTAWPPGSSPTAGRSRRCTGGSCSPAPTSSPAPRVPTPPGSTRRTGWSGGSTRSGSTSSRCATRSWRSPAPSTRR